MRVLFAGPSLFGAKPDLRGIDVRGPASQGDVTKAVVEGASAIGLIDGHFETMASVWHKELLFALSSGAQVLGAASMGALRAAECAQFGMKPVGRIARQYLDGELDDDAAVAQLHTPWEMGGAPLTEALVDVHPTIAKMRRANACTPDEAAALLDHANGLFFKDRTIAAIVDGAHGIVPSRRSALKKDYHRLRVWAKQSDALELVRVLRNLPTRRVAPPPGWELSRTPEWQRTLGRMILPSSTA